MAFFMPLRLGAVARLAMAGLALTVPAQAVPGALTPATNGAGAATRPALMPAAPIAPKPSAPRAGGNAGNMSTGLVKAPVAQSLKSTSNTSQASATGQSKDVFPTDPTLTMVGSQLGQ